MKVYCAGFNLYGQFPTIQDVCIQNFTKTDYEDLVDLDISHTFSIAQVNDKTFLHGYINKESHQTQELTFGTELIKEVSVSENYALFLTDIGQIWKLTENPKECKHNIELLPDFVKNDLLEDDFDDRIIKISCGLIFSCAYSENGYLFNIPTKLDTIELKIDIMCCGREHCLILTDDGSVYSFGCGSRGQLGHGDLEDQEEPKLILALAGIKFTKIACGSWHSCALSMENDLYVWGWNSNGQLGLKATEPKENEEIHISVMATPHIVDLDQDIKDVACGSRHTLFLLEDNKLYGVGWNKYNQLGIKTEQEDVDKITCLADFSNESVYKLKCGPWNSAVLTNI